MMACRAANTPLLRNVLRSYSTQADTKFIRSTTKIEQTTLPNKLSVVSVQTNAPLARVSVLFRAGSRYENSDEIGASHGLRIAAGLSTTNVSRLAITRNLQKCGASLTASADRESITYTLEGTEDAVAKSLMFLNEVAAHQVFKPWEVKDELHRVHYENISVPPLVRVVELLHKAAFREGLGNSLYCPKSRVNKLDSEMLKRYVTSNFTAPRATVVGVGFNHSQLSAFAKDLTLPAGDGQSKPSQYYGGEIRKERGGQLAHVAIATQGAALKDTKKALAFAVLQQILGTGPCVRWGQSAGTLAKAVSTAAKQTPFATTALNAEYSDNGLFGVLVSCPADSADTIVKAAVSALKSSNINDNDLKRGKALLKFSVAATNENGLALAEELGQQALLLGSTRSMGELLQAVDAVSLSDVQDAARSVSSGKLSLAAVGNLSKVPYHDQLN